MGARPTTGSARCSGAGAARRKLPASGRKRLGERKMRVKGFLLATIAVAALASCAPSKDGTASAGNDTAAIPYGPGGATTPNPDWTPFATATSMAGSSSIRRSRSIRASTNSTASCPTGAPPGSSARPTFCNAEIAKAQTLHRRAADAAATLRARLSGQGRAGAIVLAEDADQPHTNPAYYVGGGLDPNVYVARNYADQPTRMKAMIAVRQRCRRRRRTSART